MNSGSSEPMYRVWDGGSAIHGPVNLPGLTDWVNARRAQANSWIYVEPPGRWVRAADLPELKVFFGTRRQPAEESASPARAMGVTPEVLRRIKILAQMDDSQLERFLDFIEVLSVDTAGLIVRRGSHGDAMYLLLEGEVRARIVVDGKESLLRTLAFGDFFGEISLLDQGPRSADVVANEPSVLLKLSAQAFERMRNEAPDVALSFLFNISRSVVTRMRVLTKRYNDSLQLAHVFAEE